MPPKRKNHPAVGFAAAEVNAQTAGEGKAAQDAGGPSLASSTAVDGTVSSAAALPVDPASVFASGTSLPVPRPRSIYDQSINGPQRLTLEYVASPHVRLSLGELIIGSGAIEFGRDELRRLRSPDGPVPAESVAKVSRKHCRISLIRSDVSSGSGTSNTTFRIRIDALGMNALRIISRSDTGAIASLENKRIPISPGTTLKKDHHQWLDSGDCVLFVADDPATAFSFLVAPLYDRSRSGDLSTVVKQGVENSVEIATDQVGRAAVQAEARSEGEELTFTDDRPQCAYSGYRCPQKADAHHMTEFSHVSESKVRAQKRPFDDTHSALGASQESGEPTLVQSKHPRNSSPQDIKYQNAAIFPVPQPAVPSTRLDGFEGVERGRYTLVFPFISTSPRCAVEIDHAAVQLCKAAQRFLVRCDIESPEFAPDVQLVVIDARLEALRAIRLEIEKDETRFSGRLKVVAGENIAKYHSESNVDAASIGAECGWRLNRLKLSNGPSGKQVALAAGPSFGDRVVARHGKVACPGHAYPVFLPDDSPLRDEGARLCILTLGPTLNAQYEGDCLHDTADRTASEAADQLLELTFLALFEAFWDTAR